MSDPVDVQRASGRPPPLLSESLSGAGEPHGDDWAGAPHGVGRVSIGGRDSGRIGFSGGTVAAVVSTLVCEISSEWLEFSEA